jgi:hypothetical protein
VVDAAVETPAAVRKVVLAAVVAAVAAAAPDARAEYHDGVGLVVSATSLMSHASCKDQEMSIKDFFAKINESPDITGIDIVQGTCPAEDKLVVKCGDAFTHLSSLAIVENSWGTLESWIRGLRDWNPIYQVTRIVGYYSRVQNWNSSKIGELKDRREGAKAGNYSV